MYYVATVAEALSTPLIHRNNHSQRHTETSHVFPPTLDQMGQVASHAPRVTMRKTHQLRLPAASEVPGACQQGLRLGRGDSRKRFGFCRVPRQRWFSLGTRVKCLAQQLLEQDEGASPSDQSRNETFTRFRVLEPPAGGGF